jgi:hypothetical protein
VLDHTLERVFAMDSDEGYEQEIIRAVQRVVVEQVMSLAANAPMPQVRAIASSGLAAMSTRFAARIDQAGETMKRDRAHFALLERDVERFLSRRAAAQPEGRRLTAPPGAPIGQPAPSWLDPVLRSGDLPPLHSMLDSLFPIDPVCSHASSRERMR